MKNPWMSMWLSAANKAAGPVRGFWTAEAARQQKAMANEMARAAGLAPAKKKRSSGKKKRK